jgi:hypothetical protein
VFGTGRISSFFTGGDWQPSPRPILSAPVAHRPEDQRRSFWSRYPPTGRRPSIQCLDHDRPEPLHPQGNRTPWWPRRTRRSRRTRRTRRRTRTRRTWPQDPPPPHPPSPPSTRQPTPDPTPAVPDKKKSHVKKPENFENAKDWDRYKRQTFIYIAEYEKDFEATRPPSASSSAS